MLLSALVWTPLHLKAQNEVIVSGRVISADDNETLIGVSVTEVDATNRVISGTITNIDGEYVLRVKNPGNKIAFSYLGFKSQSFPVGSSKKLNVNMKSDAVDIEEVVVTAKKTTNDGGLNISRREVSMAMTTINAKIFENISVASVDDALQGRIAGVDIVSASGAPGAAADIRIRGTSTITGNSQPLIVVNGIPYSGDVNADFDFATATEERYADLLNVSIDDIEEIVVLKDAASAAMWGSKGANGILMITTKKGARGKTRVQYSYRLSEATQPPGMKMLNGDDYTMLMKQAYFNRQLGGNESLQIIPEYNYDRSFSEFENFNENTDWVAAVTQPGWTHDHNITVMGGGERARFRISGGYYNQTGTNIGQQLERYTARSQLDYNVSDRLLFTSEFQFTYSNNNRNYSSSLNVESYSSLLDNAYKKMPNVSIFAQDEAGNNTGIYYNISRDSPLDDSQKNLMNPVALAHLARNREKSYRVIPTARLRYDFIEPSMTARLMYDGFISFDMSDTKTDRFLPGIASNYQWDNANVDLASGIASGKLTIQTENKLTWQTLLNEKHSIQAYASIQTSSSSSHSQSFSSYGHPDGLLTDATSVAYMNDMKTGSNHDRTIGALARAHYAYRGRYILDGIFRMDGSNRFGQDNRFGAFSGASAKWILSDEVFMSGLSSWLTLLAFRPSWGITGRQPDRNYLYFSRYVPDDIGYMDEAGTYPANIQLANLRWEKVTATNLGADLELWNGKYIFTFDYYHKRTRDLLFKDLNIPSTTGFTTLAYRNVGTMDNDGWEFDFATNEWIKTGKFTLDFNFNISNQVNTIIEMDPLVLAKYNDPASSMGNGVYLSRFQENNSFGSIYGLRYKGVYQYSYENYLEGKRENAPVARDANGQVMLDNNGVPKQMYYRYNSTKYAFRGGDAIYEDINHDGSIDEYDIVYLGNSNPKFSGGFGSTLRYGPFYLNLFFNYRYGNKIVNKARMEAENMYTDNNQVTTTNWRWRQEGDITEVPRAVYKQAYNWVGSDRYVEDGSFMRLKYLTLRYALPLDKLKLINISQASVSLTINNLFCLTRYSGTDPEVGYGSYGVSTDNSKTPRAKSWTLALSATF